MPSNHCRLNAIGLRLSEYSLVLALVVIVLIGALSTLGGALNSRLLDIVDQLNQAGR
ncbi:MAG: Flp family type IVb pilin [Clostridia bacterium]|nr:Flp family type IVb pilin [Clostridia bacterium]